MNNKKNASALIQFVDQYIAGQPDTLIARFEYQQQVLWLKRRPFSKKTGWHILQGVLASVIGIPILYPTVSTGGAESLFEEAERLRLFSANNIPVPEVMAVTQNFLITTDVGQQLHQHLQQLTNSEDVQRVLQGATMLLNQLHRAGLCHARPSFGDMTIKNNVISLLDLEENPLEVMTLPQAQARDIWLLLLSAARYCSKDGVQLAHLFNIYQQGISRDTLSALHLMVKKLKPLRIVLEYLCGPLLGRDGINAIKVNKALETIFSLSEQVVSTK